jgi:hypothetical protein
MPNEPTAFQFKIDAREEEEMWHETHLSQVFAVANAPR